MNKRKSDKYIPEYKVAIRSMRQGKFDLPVQVDHSDEIGKLGHELNNLALELDRKFNEIIKIREISEAIAADLLVGDVLNRAYDSFRSVIPYDRMGCALLNDDKTEVVAHWAKTDAAHISLKIGHSALMAGSSLQQIIETGQPRILNDLETYLAEHPKSASTRLIVEEGMRSSLTCPLIVDSKPVGFLFFSSMEKNTYRGIHQGTFLQLAKLVSIMVEKSLLYQQLYELNQKLLLAQRELQLQATHDALTGIYNYGAITGHLKAQLAHAKRHNQPLSIIILDVDHFKRFNDTHGHLAGDTVLRAVAARMKDCLREYDYIGRYGGEEFLVVLGNTDFDIAKITAQRLNQSVGNEIIVFGGKHLDVTISAGAAVTANGSHDPNYIISAADKELYKAKSNGRNRVEICRI